MRRFFIQENQKLESESSIELIGDEFHHLKNVCRLEQGERVELLDGLGKIAVAVISSIGKKSALLTTEKVLELPRPPNPSIEIVLCIPRFQIMDLIIQKSVELGAAKIVPVVSERSFVKDLHHDLESKISRWNKIALEACKQSGRAWPLILDEVTPLDKKIEATTNGLFLYEGESTQDVKSALEKYKEVPETLSVFVGPEGGFSPREVAKFISRGLPPVTMGPLVLRVETACIALLSVIEYHFGLMK
jgi:16S rRNA (uracil1498-N3)-methyltransferase